jgi:hypothetical protein
MRCQHKGFLCKGHKLLRKKVFYCCLGGQNSDSVNDSDRYKL